MPFVTVKGQKLYIPGVYSTISIVSTLEGPTASFQVPIMLAQADVGYPYNYPEVKYTDEAAMSPFIRCGTLSYLNTLFGYDSDMAIGYKIAADHDLPYAYVACMSKLTRATVVVQSGVGPAVNQITLYSRLFGAIGGWHKVAYTNPAGILTLTPVKRYSMLTANAAGSATRVYLRSNDWVTVGMTLYIGANAVVSAGYVVTATGFELSSTGQKLYWVDLATGLAGPITTAGYALACCYDTAIVSPALLTGEAIYQWANTDALASKYIGAKKEATFTSAQSNAIAVAVLKEIAGHGTVTAGTSPAPALVDYQDFIVDLDRQIWDEFLIEYDEVPRVFYLADSTATIHAAMATWARQKRASYTPNDFPIKVISGCAWGDTVITAVNDTSPKYRAAALDNQDFVLCANGFNWLGSYLSRAAAVFGRLVSGGVKHNLTQDRFSGVVMNETTWDERGKGELTTLHRYGVCTNRLTTDNTGTYWVISEGLSTLQSNATAWNSNDTTCLVEQRDLIDFVRRDLDSILINTQLGQDECDKNSIAATLVARADINDRNGYIQTKTYQITSLTVDPSGAGWDVADTWTPPVTVDFIVNNHTVLIAG